MRQSVRFSVLAALVLSSASLIGCKFTTEADEARQDTVNDSGHSGTPGSTESPPQQNDDDELGQAESSLLGDSALPIVNRQALSESFDYNAVAAFDPSEVAGSIASALEDAAATGEEQQSGKAGSNASNYQKGVATAVVTDVALLAPLVAPALGLGAVIAADNWQCDGPSCVGTADIGIAGINYHFEAGFVYVGVGYLVALSAERNNKETVWLGATTATLNLGWINEYSSSEDAKLGKPETTVEWSYKPGGAAQMGMAHLSGKHANTAALHVASQGQRFFFSADFSQLGNIGELPAIAEGQSVDAVYLQDLANALTAQADVYAAAFCSNGSGAVLYDDEGVGCWDASKNDAACNNVCN